MQMKPWEEKLVALWNWATKGRRSWLSIPLLLVFVLLPALGGFVKSYQELFAKIAPYFHSKETHLSQDEKDLLDQEEWGLIIARANSESDAEKKRNDFMDAYRQSGHRNVAGQLIWKNDVLIVRDPGEAGVWLVAIDMYPGPASREQLQQGVLEMIESERATGTRGEPLQRWLNGSAPYRFTKAEFELTYGNIIP
ncbi:hypothetical protein [Derxia gummosa]|uniref:Uncharacterized protein n=1 Tax=Derxia gummosa DSM 723 TaxID=1121388 RepID=A0A8B6XCN8_9BURK|nr:hypothetical protein [Derxia gummosa]